MRIGLITCRQLPEQDHDEAPLVAAIRDAGHESALIPWDDPASAPEAFDLCVFRSCWNYHRSPRAFLDWVAAADARTTLWNPREVVAWNLHKRYLADLEAAGVPTIPTFHRPRGERADLAGIAGEAGWGELVIKPAVSASSYHTRRFGPADHAEAQAFLDAHLVERDMLVQPYLSAFEDPGELAVVWIDGAVTHSVRKFPRFEGEAEATTEGLPLSAEARDLTERAVAAVDGPLLYARVDVVRGTDGRLVVSELELVEPSLYFRHGPEALERFVAALPRLQAPRGAGAR